MKKVILVLVALSMTTATVSEAQIPRTLSYQGVLTDSTTGDGRNGEFSFTFRMYDSASGGSKLWEESKVLSVTKGLFSTSLGDQTPFGSSVRFDKQYWLSIQIDNEPEFSERIPLTSVGYSMNSLRADTANVVLVSSVDSTWKTKGSDIYRSDGNVGIGTSTPKAKLEIKGTDNDVDLLLETTANGRAANFIAQGTPSGSGQLRFVRSDASMRGRIMYDFAKDQLRFRIGGIDDRLVLMYQNKDLNLRLMNNISEGRANFEVWGPSTGSGQLRFVRSDASMRGRILYDFAADHLSFRSGGVDHRLIISASGNVGIGTTNPTSKLDVVGTTTTKVLAITGGADLAEAFEISDDGLLRPGTVVVIDPDNPGNLKQATEPYDRRVAGIVSGAGGINPGLTLAQEGLVDGGQHVALIGKVYALASACNGAIEPGDLLTTSEIPGHAMKATDVSRCQGAVIGKAMSSLKTGEGLVLVLVQPQ